MTSSAPPLTPCPACARHVRAAEPACPFCAAPLAPAAVHAPPVPTQRMSRTALLVAGAASIALGAASCASVTGPGDGSTSGGNDARTETGPAPDAPPDFGNIAPPYGISPPPDAGGRDF